MYYFKEEYKTLLLIRDQKSTKKGYSRGHNPVEKKVTFKGFGVTDELETQVSTRVAVMTSELESPGTAPPTTNSKTFH